MYMNSIFHRTSVSKYLDKDVEQEKINKILYAAMAAPSACNQQHGSIMLFEIKKNCRNVWTR